VDARDDRGGTKRFEAVARADTSEEVAYYRHGGTLPYVLRHLHQHHHIVSLEVPEEPNSSSAIDAESVAIHLYLGQYVTGTSKNVPNRLSW
jgi:hypothetical protein